jgi:tetratricopeptide (TPR) repeat protein
MRFLTVVVSLGFGILRAATAADSIPSAPGPAQLNNQGVMLAAQGRYAEAEAAYRQALDGWARSAEPSEIVRDQARTLENLGSLLGKTGRYAESERTLTEALTLLENATGKSSTDVGEVLENLATLYLTKGEAQKAESCTLRADTMLAGPERTNNKVVLASIYIDEHRFADARTILEPLLPAATGKLEFSVDAALGAAALGEAKLPEAETLARRALEIASTALPPNYIGLAAVWNNLGQVCRFQKRYLEAETNYRKAIEIWTAARGPESPLVAHGWMNLAAFEHERGREHAAEELYRRAETIFEQAAGKDDLLALIAHNELGEVLRAQGRYVASAQFSRESLPAIQKLLPENDLRVLRALSNYARLLADTKRKAEATALWAHIKNSLVDAPIQ